MNLTESEKEILKSLIGEQYLYFYCLNLRFDIDNPQDLDISYNVFRLIGIKPKAHNQDSKLGFIKFKYDYLGNATGPDRYKLNIEQDTEFVPNVSLFHDFNVSFRKTMVINEIDVYGQLVKDESGNQIESSFIIILKKNREEFIIIEPSFYSINITFNSMQRLHDIETMPLHDGEDELIYVKTLEIR